MAPTITESGRKRKLYQGQFSIALAPIERMYLQYYADVFHKDEVEILRGMIRGYVSSDAAFDPRAFMRWVEKVLMPSEDDEDSRKLIREQLRFFKKSVERTVAAPSARRMGRVAERG